VSPFEKLGSWLMQFFDSAPRASSGRIRCSGKAKLPGRGGPMEGKRRLPAHHNEPGCSVDSVAWVGHTPKSLRIGI
jgi:hypothetical protein